MLSILPGGGGQLGKDGFVMLLARWRDSKNMKLHRRRAVGFWKFIQSGVGVWEIVFYHQFGARFRQTRFFNTQAREYACPVAWGLRQKFKIEKCWIFTLTTFSDRLYINRGHPAMGIDISILPIHRDGGQILNLVPELIICHDVRDMPMDWP